MKRIILFLCTIVPLLASAQIKYHIKGEVANWKANHQDSIYFFYFSNNKQITDSVAVVNGKFDMKGTTDQPYEIFMWAQPLPLKERRDGIKLYIEDGTITVKAKDSLRHAVIKGGPVNADYVAVGKLTQPILDRLVQLRVMAMNTKKEDQQTESFKALDKEYRLLQDSMVNTKKRYLQAHPKSFMALVTLTSIMPPNFSYAKFAPLYNGLDASIQKTPLGKDLAAKLEKAKYIDIGSVMPEFSSLDTTRQELNLTKVIKAGKLTLVDFWASWCGPCRAENPNVVKAFNAFHDKGFNIISVSLDKDAASWKKAIVKDGMPWYHVSGLQYWNEPVAQLFGISAVPDNFLLDANGKVLARGLRGEALYNMIATQLK